MSFSPFKSMTHLSTAKIFHLTWQRNMVKTKLCHTYLKCINKISCHLQISNSWKKWICMTNIYAWHIIINPTFLCLSKWRIFESLYTDRLWKLIHINSNLVSQTAMQWCVWLKCSIMMQCKHDKYPTEGGIWK